MLTLSISDIVTWTVDIFTLDIKKAPAVTPELIDSKFRITELDAVSTHGRSDCINTNSQVSKMEPAGSWRHQVWLNQ